MKDTSSLAAITALVLLQMERKYLEYLASVTARCSRVDLPLHPPRSSRCCARVEKAVQTPTSPPILIRSPTVFHHRLPARLVAIPAPQPRLLPGVRACSVLQAQCTFESVTQATEDISPCSITLHCTGYLALSVGKQTPAAGLTICTSPALPAATRLIAGHRICLCSVFSGPILRTVFATRTAQSSIIHRQARLVRDRPSRGRPWAEAEKAASFAGLWQGFKAPGF